MSFSWSYSALNDFETCPKRYYEYRVAKSVKEPESDALREGRDLHKAFEMRTKGGALQFPYTHYEPMFQKIDAAPGKAYAEQKLALRPDFTPCAYFAKDVWYRGVIDLLKISPPSAAVIDWKTGKPKEDLTQLQLCAAMTFAWHSEVNRVHTALVYAAHDQKFPAEFVREDLTEIWGDILPRVKAMEKARADNNYPPKPSGLCRKFCGVVACPYHGKGG